MNESSLFSIKDVLFNGNQDPHHNAIECPGCEPLTYRDLRQQILYVVRTLNLMGFHRNDRIAVITPAGPETAVIIISVMAGFTVIPLNPQYREQEFADIFSRLSIKAIIVQKEGQTAATNVAMLRNIPIIQLVPVSNIAGKFDLSPAVLNGLVEPEFAIAPDNAYILLTSGATAESKVVTKTQKQWIVGMWRTCIYQKITSADRCLHIIPYFHGLGGGSLLLSPLISGATVICTKDFIPSDFLHLLLTYRPTWYMASPALHAGILREIKKRPSDELKNNSLRYIRSGMAFLPKDVRRELESTLGVPVIESYGSSEVGNVSLNLPPKEGSVGIPFVDYLEVIDENDEPLKPGGIGEIIIKDSGLFNGYENAPEENRAAFIDGWFRTGDLGYLDDEGYLFLTGRKKEMINKGGEKISPSEIDAVMKSHPLVRDAMAFGIAEPVLGEDIAAMVVPADERITETDLRMYLIDRLVQFKIPKRIYFVDAIPKTPTGKPQRYIGTQRYS